MSVRIIGGDWRGRTLATPPGREVTRPLTGRIKQSLFDRLGQRLDGQRVADVCAGSGSFGFEAASRGAAAVTLIEADRRVAGILEDSWLILGRPATVTIRHAPFQRALPDCAPADLIYADPPFPWYREQPLLLQELISLALPALAQNGRFLMRGERGFDPPVQAGAPADVWRYGRSWIAVWERQF